MLLSKEFLSLHECVEFIRHTHSSSEYVWCDASRVVCDPQKEFYEDTPSLVVPPGHRHRTAIRPGNRGWEQTLPRYLFRGEGSVYRNTCTSLSRMVDDTSLSAEEKSRIRDLTRFVMEQLHDQEGERWMSWAFAEACCQH